MALEVLYVDPDAEELDDGGMVLNLTSDSWEFLLAGDATPKVQQNLIDNYDLEAKILKVPHHGDEQYYTIHLWTKWTRGCRSCLTEKMREGFRTNQS